MAAVLGRDVECAAAEDFLAAASTGGAVLLLEGQPGIGKSTVWRHVVHRAQGREFSVRSCRAAAAETRLALSGVADLFAGLPPSATSNLPEPQRRALDAALLRVPVAPRLPAPRALAMAVRSLLADMADAGPVLIAVDDTQWLDRASAAALAFALRRLDSAPVGWLLARRDTGEGDPLSVTALTADRAVHLRLGPLGPVTLHRILTERLGRSLGRSVLSRIHETSGGNPLYALELARALSPHTGASPDRLPVPEPLGRLLLQRVRALPASTREALLHAAALSDPRIDVVGEADLAAAEAADMVQVDAAGRISFAHPLYAAVVYAAAPMSQRRRIHSELARTVDDAEERARHLAAAATRPDEDVAAAVEQGAERARARGAWNSAADLFELARRLTPAAHPRRAQRRGIAAVEHHVLAGDRGRARRLVVELLAGPVPPGVRAQALRLLAEISYNDENFPEAGRLLAEALRHADDPGLRATIELGIGYVAAYDLDFAAGSVHARRAVELATASGDPGLVAVALAQSVMYEFLCGHGVDWPTLRRSLASEDPARLGPLQSRPTVVHAMLQLYVGHHAAARTQLLEIRRAALERGDESDLAFVVLWLGWLETRCGRLDAAGECAEEAATFAALTGSESVRVWALMQRALVRALRGDEAGSRADCAHTAELARAIGYTMPTIWIAASRAVLELSLGNPAAAWAACEPLTTRLEAQGIGEPVPAFFLPDAIEALIALGELDRAARLVTMLEERGRALGRTWALATGARCRGLLLAAGGDVVAAGAAMQEARAHSADIELPFELARTLLAHGGIERRARRRGAARDALTESLALFERVGARLWAARARVELERLDVRRIAGRDLTDGEQRVAELAAAGLANREVATALFVSPKTVEAHLARIYRKLGIRSRAELGAVMGARVRSDGRGPAPADAAVVFTEGRPRQAR